MATLEELVVQLVAETSGLRAELDKAAKSTATASDKMEKSIKEFTESSTKSLGFWETALANAAGFIGSQAVIGAFNALKDGAKFLADQFVEGAKAAIAEENALTRLANSLALTGQYSKETLSELTAFAGQMERQTGIADDVVASNLAMLSSLTKLNGEGLQKAQTAAIDLSAAMNIDLNTATMLVGKGINGNVEAFKRYGITINEGANSTENLANIMKGLASTQGAGAAAMKTFDGSLIGVKNSYGNLIEVYGAAVVQNDAFINALGVLKGGLDDATDSAASQDQQLKILAGETLVVLLDSLAGVITVIDIFGRAGSIAISTVEMAFAGLGATITGILSVFDSKFEESFNAFTEQAAQASIKAEAAFSGDTLLGDVSVKLLEMGDAAEKGLGAIRSGAESTIAPTVAAGEAVRELTAAEKVRLDQLKGFATALAEQGAALDGQYAYESEALKLHMDNKLITEQEYFDAKNEMTIAQQEVELANLQAAKDAELLTDQQYADAKLALERKQTLDSLKNSADRQKGEEAMNKQRTADLNSTLGTISSLQSSSNKELAMAGKAAAMAQATIDGYAAVQKALSSAPPPFNFALAALVGAATAQNISKIKSVGLNTGGTLRGGGANQDTVSASLTKGETVVDRTDTQRLSKFLDNAENNGSGTARIEIFMNENLIEFVEAKILERQRIGVSLLGSGV
jgi:hypothetical protein